jgi:hypothetical protein
MQRAECERLDQKKIHDFKITHQKLLSPLNHIRSVVHLENYIQFKVVLLISVIEFI